MKPEDQALYRYADQLPESLWDDLCSRSAHEAAEAVGAVREAGTFRLPLVGVEYVVDPAARRIFRPRQPGYRCGFQTGVVLLTTLAASKGVPPSGRMTVPQDLPGGRMFFVGAHALAVAPLARAFNADPGQVCARAAALGAEPITGADAALRIAGLPNVPLYVLLWHADDESAARAVIGIDDRAHFHLDLSGIFALTNILAHRLCTPGAVGE